MAPARSPSCGLTGDVGVQHQSPWVGVSWPGASGTLGHPPSLSAHCRLPGFGRSWRPRRSRCPRGLRPGVPGGPRTGWAPRHAAPPPQMRAASGTLFWAPWQPWWPSCSTCSILWCPRVAGDELASGSCCEPPACLLTRHARLWGPVWARASECVWGGRGVCGSCRGRANEGGYPSSCRPSCCSDLGLAWPHPRASCTSSVNKARLSRLILSLCQCAAVCACPGPSLGCRSSEPAPRDARQHTGQPPTLSSYSIAGTRPWPGPRGGPHADSP